MPDFYQFGFHRQNTGQPPALDVTLDKTIANPGESITITIIVTSDVDYELTAYGCGCAHHSNFINDPVIEDKFILTITIDTPGRHTGTIKLVNKYGTASVLYTIVINDIP